MIIIDCKVHYYKGVRKDIVSIAGNDIDYRVDHPSKNLWRMDPSKLDMLMSIGILESG